MTKMFVLILALTSLNLFASELKPGLWEVGIKIFQNGKEIDPLKEIMKEIEKLPEAQRKMIVDQIMKDKGKSNIKQVCYTKEMVSQPEKHLGKEIEDCHYKEESRTGNKVVSSFKCDDGAYGKAVWEKVDSNNFKFTLDATQKGEKSHVEYTTKFLKADCK